MVPRVICRMITMTLPGLRGISVEKKGEAEVPARSRLGSVSGDKTFAGWLASVVLAWRGSTGWSTNKGEN